MTSRKMGMLSNYGEFSYTTNYHFPKQISWRKKMKHKNLDFTFLYLCGVRAIIKHNILFTLDTNDKFRKFAL